MRRFIFAAVIVLAFASAGNAQTTDCATASQALSATLTPPTGFVSVKIGPRDGSGKSSVLTANAAGVVAVDAPTLALWQEVAKFPASVLLWTAADGRTCAQTFAGAPAVMAPPAGSTTSDGDPATGNCASDGQAWLNQLEPTKRSPRVTVILFNGPNACYRSDVHPRKPAAHGDPIYVGVLTQTLSEWSAAEAAFSPCDIESAIVIQPHDAFPASLRNAGGWRLKKFLPRSCWNDAVTISITGPGPAKAGLVLQQYPRYRATVHLGLAATEFHETTFGLRTDGTAKKIFSKGPSGKGPEYTASVVFYSVLKYVPPLFGGRPYKGREIRNEQNVFDRIGFAAGVGVKDPFKRFVTGPTFEVVAGVNLFLGWDFYQVPQLAGVKDGDVFTGEEAQIPVTREWQKKKVAGVTFDLAYAAKLFK